MKVSLSSIAIRLPLAIASLCLLVAGGVSYLGYTNARAGMEDQAMEKLELAVSAGARGLGEQFASIAADLELMSASSLAAEALVAFRDGRQALPGDPSAQMRRWFIDENPNPTGQKDRLDRPSEASAYADAHARFHPYFRDLKDKRGYYDVFLIDASGEVVYTVFKEPDFATNLENGPWQATGLGEVFRRAVASGARQQAFVDFAPYEPSNGAAAAFVGQRITGADGTVLGAIVFQMPIDRIHALVSDGEGLGETGHMTLVGPDLTTRNASRFEGEYDLLSPVADSEALRRALAGEPGQSRLGVGHDGNPVMEAFRPVKLWDQTWALAIEQDRAELLASTDLLRRKMLATMALSAVLTSFLGWLLGRAISRPLGRIGEAMDRIKANAFDTVVPFEAKQDEIGGMARNLANFRDTLKAAQDARQMMVFKSRAFEGSGTAMMVVDRDLKILDYNQSLRELFRAKLEVMRQYWPEFDPENLIGVCIDKFHKNPEHQRRLLSDPGNLPYLADIAMGETRLGLFISSIFDDEGNYVGNSLQWSDVRDERINKSIIDAIRRNQAMIEYDQEFRILAINDNFTKIFGYGQEVIGKTIEQLFGPNTDTRIQMERLRAGLTVQRKVERSGKDGKRIWVEISMNPIQNRSGALDRIVEIASDVTKSEAARAAAEAERERQSEGQKQVVEELRRGLEALARGDLTMPLDRPFAPEYESLRGNFNAAQEQLTQALSRLVAATGNISSGAVEISQAADDLSRRTENQAATLEETAAALDELTASVRSATEGAAAADQAVRTAREGAEASGQVVLQAVAAMSEIEKSSGQISQIIGVIDDIAFQTNLLALNAGVEAARAGDAGRGFAVVASEVRSLAQRSSEAAKEIKALISASSQQVERGVALVGETGRALHEIVASVSRISTLVSELASSSREQSIGLGEINTGVNQLDQVTQQNAAMVEESTAASHSLKNEAEALVELVSGFRIPTAAGATLQVARPRAEPRPAPRARVATGTDDWKEF